MRSVFEQGHFTSIQEQYWVFCGVCFASGKLILENFRQVGGRRCKKSTLNDLVHLTPLRIPLMNPPNVCRYQRQTGRQCHRHLLTNWLVGITFLAYIDFFLPFATYKSCLLITSKICVCSAPLNRNSLDGIMYLKGQ